MSAKIEENTEKSDDKKDIEMEEREQMLNAENKTLEKVEETGEDKRIKSDNKEGMEVKPKKIPIGGIQMPGFFTRSKSKEKCKVSSTGVKHERAHFHFRFSRLGRRPRSRRHGTDRDQNEPRGTAATPDPNKASQPFQKIETDRRRGRREAGGS
jgi:hypothetical protein